LFAYDCKNDGGVENMINRKLIVGLLAIFVIFMTVQGIGPVMAAEGGSSYTASSNGSYGGTVTVTDGGGFYLDALSIGVDKGQGMVCWSGTSNGCTQTEAVVWLHPGETLTVTAKGADGYNFASWDTTNLSSQGASSAYTIIPTNPVNLDEYVPITHANLLANFIPA
jgi:hypothetical protein